MLQVSPRCQQYQLQSQEDVSPERLLGALRAELQALASEDGTDPSELNHAFIRTEALLPRLTALIKVR
jgi:hypothetical protein